MKWGSNRMGGYSTRSMSENCYHQVEQRRQFLIIFNNGICIASLSVEKLYCSCHEVCGISIGEFKKMNSIPERELGACYELVSSCHSTLC